MPIGLSDGQLAAPYQQTTEPSNEMLFATHLFKAAKLNSEIKYIAQSIVRDSPRYAYPRVIDINDWQTTMLNNLDEWSAQSIVRDSPRYAYPRVVDINDWQ